MFSLAASINRYKNKLTSQVEKYRITAAEAIENKEETELKCQHKIADMVALMEKHKVRSSFRHVV